MSILPKYESIPIILICDSISFAEIGPTRDGACWHSCKLAGYGGLYASVEIHFIPNGGQRGESPPARRFVLENRARGHTGTLGAARSRRYQNGQQCFALNHQ